MTQDQILTCNSCHTPFLWTGGEQTVRERPEHCPMCQRIAPAPGRQRGLIKWYSRARGYGFITSVAGAEVFFHKSGLAPTRAPAPGQLVEFRINKGPRGAQAEDVEILLIPVT